MVISDDQRRLLLAQAAMAQAGNEKDLIFVDSDALKYSQYHQYLKKRLGTRWPGDPPKGKPQLINPLAVIPLFAALQRSNTVFYMHPSFGYYFEFFYLQPHGLSYKLNAYSNTNLLAPPLTEDLVVENETFWSKADAQVIQPLLPSLAQPSGRRKTSLLEGLAKLTHLGTEPNQDALSLAGLYSRGLDYWAVQLQKKKELEKAAAHFERALDLNPDNVAAQVNLDCNRKLRAGKQTAVQVSKAISDKFGKYRTWDMVVGENGPFDEPTFCYEQGRVYIQTKLFRQAMEEFARVTELDATHLPARLWLAQLYIVSRRPEMALQVVEEIHQKEADFGVSRTNMNELLFAEASAHLAKKDTAGADAAVERTVQKYPGSVDLLATATQVYMNFGFYSNALGTIEQQLKLAPDNPAALINKGFALLQINACEQAIPPLTRVLTMQSTNYSALLNRAIAYLRCDKLDDAQHDYQTLQKAFPTAFQIYYGLEEVDYHKKDTNSAIRNCELYLANAPTNSDEAKFIRGRLEELKGAPR